MINPQSNVINVVGIVDEECYFIKDLCMLYFWHPTTSQKNIR